MKTSLWSAMTSAVLFVAITGTVLAESTWDKLKNVAEKLQQRNLSGEYTYQVTGYRGLGVAKVEQQGNQIRMFLTWTPAGQAPHYEVKGKLVGNTIDGKWYSHHAKKGWYNFHDLLPLGVVDPDEASIRYAGALRTVLFSQSGQGIF